jgi:hypothetical protein
MSNRPIRLVRKREVNPIPDGPVSPDAASRPEPSEREVKTVVSRWVEDHRKRAEEFRRSFAVSLRAGEFHLPTR